MRVLFITGFVLLVSLSEATAQNRSRPVGRSLRTLC